MSNHGIAVFIVGTYVVAGLFIAAGLAAVIAEWVMKYRQRKRIHRRMFETGYRFSTKDFK
jgi:hypothetical protein